LSEGQLVHDHNSYYYPATNIIFNKAIRGKYLTFCIAMTNCLELLAN